VQERVDFLQARYKFLGKFKDGVFSHLIGTRKPDVKIYKAALEKTSSKPSDCIYIDDKPELLAPAKKLGMNVIHFESPAKLKAKLRLMGVNL
jgi:HAD superfamily hydrolase (TIGR01509 family)